MDPEMSVGEDESMQLLHDFQPVQSSFRRSATGALLILGCVLMTAFYSTSKPSQAAVEMVSPQSDMQGRSDTQTGSESLIELAGDQPGLKPCLDSALEICETSIWFWKPKPDPPHVSTKCDTGKSTYTAVYDKIAIYDHRFLSLRVTAENYSSIYCGENGLSADGEFGIVALDSGAQVTLLYQLIDSEKWNQNQKVKEVTVDSFVMTWFDFSECMDARICEVEGGKGSDSYVQAFLAAGSNIQVKAEKDCMLLQTDMDVPIDIPLDPMDLTPAQEKSAATIAFHETSRWTMTFTSRQAACGEQTIMFSGLSTVLNCDQPAVTGEEEGGGSEPYSVMMAFECEEGNTDAEPLQVICYDHSCDVKALKLNGDNAGKCLH